jgi:hypothetical protein
VALTRRRPQQPSPSTTIIAARAISDGYIDDERFYIVYIAQSRPLRRKAASARRDVATSIGN